MCIHNNLDLFYIEDTRTGLALSMRDAGFLSGWLPHATNVAYWEGREDAERFAKDLSKKRQSLCRVCATKKLKKNNDEIE